MEGVSGVIAPAYVRFGTSEYAQGRESLTADVNAAVRGLKAGGAGAVWVQDGRGSGNSQEPDLLASKLHEQATFDLRDRPYNPYSTSIDASVDAIVCIGMHARARTQGFMAHTNDLRHRLERQRPRSERDTHRGAIWGPLGYPGDHGLG
jgi:D-aminopeptidase